MHQIEIFPPSTSFFSCNSISIAHWLISWKKWTNSWEMLHCHARRRNLMSRKEKIQEFFTILNSLIIARISSSKIPTHFFFSCVHSFPFVRMIRYGLFYFMNFFFSSFFFFVCFGRPALHAEYYFNLVLCFSFRPNLFGCSFFGCAGLFSHEFFLQYFASLWLSVCFLRRWIRPAKYVSSVWDVVHCIASSVVVYCFWKVLLRAILHMDSRRYVM